MSLNENEISSNPQCASPKNGPLRSFASGVWRLVERILVLTAYTLVGASACVAHGMVRGGGRAVEEILGGAAIGVISAVLRITGFHHALGVGVGALLGWIACFSLRQYMLAPMGALFGGLLAALVLGKPRHDPVTAASEVSSPPATTPSIVSPLLGIVVGGFVGALVGAWLCMIAFFHVWLPSQLPREVGTVALLVPFGGLLGAAVGAVTGARCLYLWAIRRQAKQPRPEDVIRDYERWKQSHRSEVAGQNEDLPG
jgi:hypothetical protein